MKNVNFPVRYWFPDHSVKVVFEPIAFEPEIEQITACFAFVYTTDDKVLLIKPKKREWGLPGGYREKGETPSACLKREVFEEANVEIKNIRPIARQRITLLKETASNQQYPRESYIMLYLAEVDKIKEFSAKYETTKRDFVMFQNIKKEYGDKIDETLLEKTNYAIDFLKNERIQAKLH